MRSMTRLLLAALLLAAIAPQEVSAQKFLKKLDKMMEKVNQASERVDSTVSQGTDKVNNAVGNSMAKVDSTVSQGTDKMNHAITKGKLSEAPAAADGSFVLSETRQTKIYRMAGNDAQVLTTVEPGHIMKVKKTVNDWYKVDFRGTVGFVKADGVRLMTPCIASIDVLNGTYRSSSSTLKLSLVDKDRYIVAQVTRGGKKSSNDEPEEYLGEWDKGKTVLKLYRNTIGPDGRTSYGYKLKQIKSNTNGNYVGLFYEEGSKHLYFYDEVYK